MTARTLRAHADPRCHRLSRRVPCVPYTPLLYALSEVNDAIDEQLAPALADAGLTRAHWHLLYILDEQGPSRLSELAKWQRCVRSNMTRLVAAMETKGLVERRPDERDGRARQVVMSAAGKAAFRKVARVAKRLEARVTKALGQTQGDTLAELALRAAAVLDG